MTAKSEKTYEYYVLGQSNPVRLTFNSHGLKMGAETPDPHTGDLIIDNTLISRVENSPDAEKINRERFEELCLQYQKKNEGQLVGVRKLSL
jgi:hypothetical protein